ncbi:TetR/AcrR family transcriptional regulator [Aquibacillus sediminis]|uniref:TetR/AcrR family transcriptional regulator n=1 Tax=Aquibacillus sediminis TaxID=2574734 RepID=UPI001107B299|nr:TetR/AcrR family transcriptional regulator [Aquibacillus sediminis]
MDQRKEQIMESAIRWFSNKGYFATSMQEIADDCGISKGLLYKHFSSKEDLLMEVFRYNHDKMVQKAGFIKLDPDLSKEQRFRGMVVVELEGMIENKDFFNVLSKSLPMDKNKLFFPLLKKIRGELLNWHKETIYHAYGEKVKDHIWDITIVFQAMIKEFTFILTQGNMILDLDEVADFIVDYVNTIVEARLPEKPLLSSVMMREFEDLQKGMEPKTVQEKLQELIQNMTQTVSRTAMSEQERQDLLATVDLLAQEIKEKQPRTFLIRALLAYIEKYQGLKNDVQVFEKLLDLR